MSHSLLYIYLWTFHACTVLSKCLQYAKLKKEYHIKNGEVAAVAGNSADKGGHDIGWKMIVIVAVPKNTLETPNKLLWFVLVGGYYEFIAMADINVPARGAKELRYRQKHWIYEHIHMGLSSCMMYLHSRLNSLSKWPELGIIWGTIIDGQSHMPNICHQLERNGRFLSQTFLQGTLTPAVVPGKKQWC